MLGLICRMFGLAFGIYRETHPVCRIKDKNGDTALDLIPEGDTKIEALFRKARVEASVSKDDVASGKVPL